MAANERREDSFAAQVWTFAREQRDSSVVPLEAPPGEAATAHGTPFGVTFFPSDSHQGGYVSLLRKRSE